MKLEVSIEQLRKTKVMICMPTYGGMVSTLTMKSLLDQVALFQRYEIPCAHNFILNESLIQRARNYLADEFLNRSDCTHLMFIDADITFNPQDILLMLALDYDLSYGPYAKKSVNFKRIYDAVQINPKLPHTEYEKIGGDIAFNAVPGTERFSVSEPVEVMDAATGFLCIRRNVFEKFQEAHPEQMYRPDHQTEHFHSGRKICAFFDCKIDLESERYLSEDYYFTQECRKLGFKVMMLPFIKLSHSGFYNYQGDLEAIAAHLGQL